MGDLILQHKQSPQDRRCKKVVKGAELVAVVVAAAGVLPVAVTAVEMMMKEAVAAVAAMVAVCIHNTINQV